MKKNESTKWDLAELSRARSVKEFDSALEGLEERWRKLWTDDISEIVSNANGVVAEPPTLILNLESKQGFESHIWSLERRIRRFINTIDLTYMLEDRSFGDYRLTMERRIDEIKVETDSLRLRAANIKVILTNLATAARAAQTADRAAQASLEGPPCPFFGDRVAGFLAGGDVLAAAVGRSRSRIDSLNHAVSQPRYKEQVIAAVRPLWGHIHKRFGNWLVRALPALNTLKWLALVALLTYVLLGSLMPTSIWLLPLAAAAAGVSLWRYFKTKRWLERRVLLVRDGFEYINPDIETPFGEEGEKQSLGFWSEKFEVLSESDLLQKLGQDLQAGVLSSRQEPRPIEPVDIAKTGLIVALFFVAISWLLVVAVDCSSGGWPSYAVTSNSPPIDNCVLAFGKVLWAGPGHLVMKDSERGLTFIPPGKILRIQRNEKRPATCMPAGNLQQATLLTVLSPGTAFQESAIIPFSPGGEVRGCDPFFGKGTEPTEIGGEVLQKFAAQYKGKRIDVRGFSSMKEFSCPSADQSKYLNWKLAEQRRAAVLKALGANLSADGSRWECKDFVLDPASATRFTDESEMRKHDCNQNIARYAEIVISNGEPDPGCKKMN